MVNDMRPDWQLNDHFGIIKTGVQLSQFGTCMQQVAEAITSVTADHVNLKN